MEQARNEAIIKALVYGGTSSVFSNRASETADQLDAVNFEIADKVTSDIADCKTIEQLKSVLKDLSLGNMNLVGTRDLVYMASAMLNELMEMEDAALYWKENDENYTDSIKRMLFLKSNLFTRTCGLRSKAAELLLNL